MKERGEGEADLAAALALAEAASGVTVALQRCEVAAGGWLARNFASFPEQLVGRRFAIRGSHLTGPKVAGRITLTLDAGMAFGSGEHGSTRACLGALEGLTALRPRRLLDLGTGTGVLALAAARLLHRPVVAADIDPWSVRDARANAVRNGLRRRVIVRRSDGWRSGWLRGGSAVRPGLRQHSGAAAVPHGAGAGVPPGSGWGGDPIGLVGASDPVGGRGAPVAGPGNQSGGP